MPENKVPTVAVSTLIAALSLVVVMLAGVFGGAMTFADQKSHIEANATAIKTNKSQNDKEHTAQSKATSDLVNVIKELTTATTELKGEVKVLQAQRTGTGG